MNKQLYNKQMQQSGMDQLLSNKHDTKTKIDFKILSQLIAFHSKQNIIKLLLDVNLLLMN